MTMTMTMTVRLAAALAVRAVRRQIHDMTVTHAALGDDVIGKFLHVETAAFEHGDFHAAVVIEVHVQRCLREIVTIRLVASSPPHSEQSDRAPLAYCNIITLACRHGVGSWQ